MRCCLLLLLDPCHGLRLGPLALSRFPPTAQPLGSRAVVATASATSSSAGLSFAAIPKSKIRKGDFVAHNDYGIGQFEGVFQTKAIVRSSTGERRYVRCLRVRFKDGVLDVPTRYAKDLKLFKRSEEVGPYGQVRLDAMRARKTWQRRKERAAKKVFAVAADLIHMYAARQNLTRLPCPPDDARMAAFAAAFEYEPTPDQRTCFDELEADMVQSSQPMDRLVCGDVGFGKTEVAMRAIFRAVCAERQVALLAPTTVLAAQHLRVLRRRMPDVRVEILSSLTKRTAAETAALHSEIAAGEVQVLVGTHALLSPKVSFARLGLLVVDEEQRFGVRQKEKIKGVAKQVDVLSLSATPIPRTMYMCIAGIRNMSVLNTPPAGRLPVETTLLERDDTRMIDAVQSELARGGQVFYVVPRIEMLEREVELLRERLPSARVGFAFAEIMGYIQ